MNFFVCTIIAAIMINIGAGIGYVAERGEIQEEAVKAGVAHYDATTAEFKFNQCLNAGVGKLNGK